MADAIKMKGVREYAECLECEFVATDGSDLHAVFGEGVKYEGAGRLVVRAYNQAGHDCTEVDILDLLQWLRNNRPDLLEIKQESEDG